MALSKDEVLAAVAARSKSVEQIDVPEWGGTVCIRRLTAADVESTGLADGKRDAQMFARVFVACLADEDGTTLFGPDEADALVGVDMATAARVFAECMRVNGLLDSDLKEAVQAFASAQDEPSSSS